jgi:hypothetical protein
MVIQGEFYIVYVIMVIQGEVLYSACYTYLPSIVYLNMKYHHIDKTIKTNTARLKLVFIIMKTVATLSVCFQQPQSIEICFYTQTTWALGCFDSTNKGFYFKSIH